MIWIYVSNPNMMWIDIGKFKLNGVDESIIQSKHAMECKKLKDNCSSNLMSLSKTISPFLIKLTMTHKMKFVSSATFVSVTWDVIWILVTTTFFSNVHLVREYIYVYTNLWDGRVPVLMDLWMFRHLGVLQCYFFSCGSLPKGRNGVCCPILFHNSIEQG